eukprot:COSAG04_NODE_15957_length_514_cov_1.026506_1_plen_37_part_10
MVSIGGRQHLAPANTPLDVSLDVVAAAGILKRAEAAA